MGKNPAFLFYPNDWTRDTEMLPLEVTGAWITIMCAMWYEQDRGKKTGDWIEWGRLLRTSPDDARRLIEYLIRKKVCDVTERNGEVTLICRRMVREEKDRINNLLRQKKHRKREYNAKSNASVTALSQPTSVSVSYSVTNTDIKTSSKQPSADPVDKTDQDIKSVAEMIYKKGWWDKVHGFINTTRSYNRKAVLHTLNRFVKARNTKVIDEPWGYCAHILQIEGGNYEEREAIAKHEELKKEMSKPSEFNLSNLCKSIP